MRVAMPRAIEPNALEGVQPVIGRAQRMLAGQDQSRPQSNAGEGRGDRFEFDGFRASPDDDVDTLTGQPSP